MFEDVLLQIPGRYLPRPLPVHDLHVGGDVGGSRLEVPIHGPVAIHHPLGYFHGVAYPVSVGVVGLDDVPP